MSPGLYQAILSFAKGSDPPLKADTETTDDFQTRSILWMKTELKGLRLLMWALLLMQLGEWMKLGPVGY